MKLFKKISLGYFGSRMKRAFLKVRNPAIGAAAQIDGPGLLSQSRASAAFAQALADFAQSLADPSSLTPEGISLAFPGVDAVVRTGLLDALIRGPCTMLFEAGVDVIIPVAPWPERLFTHGGRLEIGFGGGITFGGGIMIEAPLGCDVTVIPGCRIQFVP